MKNFRRTLVLFFTIIQSTIIFSQFNTNCTENLKFCLEEGSTMKMFPSDFLILPSYKDFDYTLVIKDLDEKIVQNNILNYTSVQKYYTYEIKNKLTNEGCSASFSVEPKQNDFATAICNETSTIYLDENGSAFINTDLINNGSLDYVSLYLNNTIVNCIESNKNGKIKLSAVGSNNVIHQCMSTLYVGDNLAPILTPVTNVFNIEETGIHFFGPQELVEIEDNCSIKATSIVPEFIYCGDESPVEVKIVVTDHSGNTSSMKTNVYFTKTVLENPVLECKAQLEIIANPSSPTTIEPFTVANNYNLFCTDLVVKIFVNGIESAEPSVKIEDVGQDVTYQLIHEPSGTMCSGDIRVVSNDDCFTSTFKVCDHGCPDGNPGDCSSIYTDTDNIDWPCIVEIVCCDTEFANKFTPDDLINYHLVSPANARPQIINFNCPAIYLYYKDNLFLSEGVGSPSKKIIRQWTVLNWMNGDIFEYIQIIKIIATHHDICDTQPWNTPVGNCDSGHTMTDAVEWPANITVSQGTITLQGLKNNLDVNPNDVEPIISVGCNNTFSYSYMDQVTEIDSNTKLITRTWSITNWYNNNINTYDQKITYINLSNSYSVCANNFHGEPIENVNMSNLGVTSSTGCTNINYIPNFNIIPTKEGSANEGVDVMDLVAVYEYLLGTRSLNPYQIMAADISSSGTGVSALDLTLLEQMVNGEISDWGSNIPVWKFIDANHHIINNQIQPANNFINTDQLFYSNSFVGIKTGDVDGSFQENIDSNRPLFAVLKAEDNILNRGETYSTPFYSDRNQNIAAVLFEFEINNEGLTVQDVSSSILPGFTMDKNVSMAGNKIKISWAIDLINQPSGVSLRNNEDIITLHYVANNNSVLSGAINLSETTLHQIKQLNTSTPTDVGLFWETKIINGVKNVGLTNVLISPNPFNESINILGLNDDAEYALYNVNGQIIQKGTVKPNTALNLSNIPNGFFMLEVQEIGKRPSISKLIKIQ